MRSFEEIIKDCVDNRGTHDFNKFVEELYKNDKVNNMINTLSYHKRLREYTNKDLIQELIGECIQYVLLYSNPEYIKKNFYCFRMAVANKIRDKIKAEKNKFNYDIMDSLDAPIYDDSQTTELDKQESKDNVEVTIENKEEIDFLQKIINIGIIDKKQQRLFIKIFNLNNLYELKSLRDLMNNLENNDFSQAQVQKLLVKNAQRSKTIRKCVSHLFSFDIYAEIVEYLIENKKLKEISELILDFNKIRNYLSIVLLDDRVKNKSALINQSKLKESSYEKNIHRILSLFHKSDKNIFEIRDDYFKKISHNELSRVFETHSASNLVSNFMIIDILGKYKNKNKEEGLKLRDIMNELFLKVDYSEENKNNFRKYNLLPRLKELKKYGFVTTINNDKYSLNARFLTNEQKKSLEYVVPFFCGSYPFSSIGHFLANRLELDSKDLFVFESFNIANVLDDCITYDILTAINNNQSIILNTKNGWKEDYNPKEIILDKNKKLLKVINGNMEEYYLNDIIDIKLDKKKFENPVFSEIYSYYYKIFEELIKKYKENPNYNISEILDKYGSDDTSCNIKQIKEILPKLARLKHTTIPLTNLELRWLKTIMQDVRFDLFVSEEEKHSLKKLVEDVEPFNLSSFKIYDDNKKEYKSITNTETSKGIKDKKSFREDLKKLNSVLFSIQKNMFKDFNYKTT